MHTNINNNKINTCNQKQILNISTTSNKQALAALTNKPQYLHKGSFLPKNSAEVNTSGVVLGNVRHTQNRHAMLIKQLEKAIR